MNKSCRNILVFAGILLFAIVALAKDSKVRIHVNPAQASIYVDGTPFGDSSRTVTIAPGKHTIGVYNYGYTPLIREVNLEAGTTTGLEFKLDPIPGQTKGPWGRIQIEGASRATVLLNGKTPEFLVGHGDEFNNGGEWFACCLQQLVVPAGTHQLTLVGQYKELWSGPVTVGANQRVIIYIPSGRTKVKPWPEGAQFSSLDRFKAGTASAAVAIAPVSGNLTAQRNQINCGESTQLSWTTAETVQRTITVDSQAVPQQAPSGELSVQPKATTTYDLQAAGPGGTVNQSDTVHVNTAVQSSLQASPTEVRYHRIGDKVLEQGSANLSWNVSNANAVSIDPLGTVNPADNQVVKPTPKQEQNGAVDETQTYMLTAKNECGGSGTQTATVHIVGSIEPIPDVPLASIFYPTGYPDKSHPQAGLVNSQQQRLTKTAEGFKKYLEYDPDAKLTVIGNADVRDSRARNKALSERRANRVKEYLVALGIPESKIDVIAQGKDKQIDASAVKLLHAQNPTPAPKKLASFPDLVWAYNRRVDLVLKPKDVSSSQDFPGDTDDAATLVDSRWPNHKEIIVLASEKQRLPDSPK